MIQSNPCPWMKLILKNYPQWLDEFRLYTCKWMTWILDGCQIYQLVEISFNWWMKQFNEISC
jgi:hypothetical protein